MLAFGLEECGDHAGAGAGAGAGGVSIATSAEGKHEGREPRQSSSGADMAASPEQSFRHHHPLAGQFDKGRQEACTGPRSVGPGHRSDEVDDSDGFHCSDGIRQEQA
jgi:hypothetical protein